VSSHEHERLSAYLDGELAPEEISAVAAHVASCAECAAWLAEFAAVDEAAAELAATAPSGYFEALPGRMRSRLEPRTARVRRLPVWTWAAAAALLLAVVTPLTLSKRPATERATDAVAPAREMKAAAPPATLEAPVLPTKLQEAVPTPPAAFAATPMPARPAANSASASDERLKREQGFAAAPAEESRIPAEPAPEARHDSAALAPASSTPSALSSRLEPQAAPAHDRDAGAAERESAGTRARKPAAAAPEPKTADALADAQAQAAPAAKAVQQGGAAGLTTGSFAEKDAASDEEWRRLMAVRPRTLADWRRLREELRRFVDAAPDGLHADAARVRAIEAGYATWRSGGDEADAAVFRQDAAAYLERGEDAKNKARVRGLLR